MLNYTPVDDDMAVSAAAADSRVGWCWVVIGRDLFERASISREVFEHHRDNDGVLLPLQFIDDSLYRFPKPVVVVLSGHTLLVV